MRGTIKERPKGVREELWGGRGMSGCDGWGSEGAWRGAGRPEKTLSLF